MCLVQTRSIRLARTLPTVKASKQGTMGAIRMRRRDQGPTTRLACVQRGATVTVAPRSRRLARRANTRMRSARPRASQATAQQASHRLRLAQQPGLVRHATQAFTGSLARVNANPTRPLSTAGTSQTSPSHARQPERWRTARANAGPATTERTAAP